MKKRMLWMLCLLAVSAAGVSGESLSFTSPLNSSGDVFTTTLTLATADAVTLPAGHS